MPSTSNLQIGVIGTGGMGSRHALNLHRHVVGATVAALYDLDGARAAQVAAQAGGAQVFDDPQRLIDDPGVDALVIAAPDPAHADLARACVRAGKPVLCEKPLATSAGEAQRVVADEVALGRRLVAVGFMRRFDPPHVALREALQSGALGRPVLLKGSSREIMIEGDLPVATILTNSVIHDLDSARWLLGQEAAEVFVRGVRSRSSFGPDTLDVMMLHLQMTGDTMASIEASLAVEYGYEIAAEVVCERGTAETTQPDLVWRRWSQQRSLHVAADWLERFQTAYVAELQAWVAALRAGRTFEGASAWDGYMASVIADACIEAVHTGKPMPVAQPARPPLYG